ncbi:Sn1-specific diacylglycerol lipase alpha [Carex littledalei]|uniref:Sn1-specific diacylglycerol lipase alpha n=1 Tax=Carex littledalei TaxID=544730 RepID=A0A833VHH6_9POAL|nr:Sn1-specific diacylglycerol lipase alpha [Carex littledalei]
MGTATVATAAGMAIVLYFVFTRSLLNPESPEKVVGGWRKRKPARRPTQAPANWREAVSTLAETLRFTYGETLGKWPIGDLAFGIKYLMRRQLAGYSKEDALLQEPKAGILKPAFAILRDESSKSFLLLVRGTHSIKDTLTAATGAVVPFHHSLVDQGGVTKLVLGYAHCGMVAGARWIAKCTIPCLQLALSQNPDYKIKIVGHSLGGGTAALLTYILREHEEFFSSTCVAFAPAACMTWDLAESGKQFITAIVNGADIVPTFSTASIDDLRCEVTASSWINDLRDQVQQTPLLNVVYRSASALGSRLPSISTARERVAGARLLLRPVSTKTQGVMKGAQNVAQVVAKTHTALSSWSCIGRRRRTVGPGSQITDPTNNQNIVTQLTVTSETIIIQEENFKVSSPDMQTIATEDELESDNAKASDHDQDQDSTEEDTPLLENKETRVSSVGEITEGELWYELEKELHLEGTKKRTREAEAAVAKEIIEEENEVRKEAVDEGAHLSDQTQAQILPEGQQRFYPPGRIMHMVVLPPCASESTGEEEVDASVITEECSVGIYETPRELYSRIRFSKSMINDHYMPMYKKIMEMLIEKFAKAEEAGCINIH